MTMAVSVLKKLNKRAKELVKKKGISYKAAQKQAGREMRTGKKVSGVKKKSAPKKRRSVGAVPVKRKKISLGKVGSAIGTVAHHISQAKAIVSEQLGRKLLRRDQATTKTEKKRIGKDIAVLRKKLKALS